MISMTKQSNEAAHRQWLVLVCAAVLAGLSPAVASALASAADLNVRSDCHAAGNGTNNDTIAIQNCITTAASTGQAVYFPAGTYAITEALVISSSNISLRGENEATTTIVQHSPAANLFTIANGHAVVDKVVIKEFELYYSSQNPSGATIYCGNCWRSYFQQLSFGRSSGPSTPKHYISTGIWANGGNQIFVEESRFNYTSSQAMYFAGVGDVYLSNLEINDFDSDTTTTGVVFDTGVGGIYATNVNVTGGETGFLFENLQPNGVPPNFGFFTNCLADTVNGVGWQFESATSMRLTNSWAATAGVYGVLIKSVNGLSITDSRIYNNGSAGISLGAGALNVSIKNSTIAGNSRLAHGSNPGISVASGVAGFQVLDNSIGGYDGFGNTQSYAIGIAGGPSNNFMIVGNNLKDNVSGELNNGATGTSFVIANNL